MLERDYSEKRDFIRMRINTPAQVHIEQEGVITEGICNDLSGSGMLLTVAKELPIDSELVITLTPNENKGPSLQARCRVARAQKAGKGNYLLGLEILEIVAEKDAQVA
jgi:c-di-GMP-binding flagellar brake protein YcgR